MAGRSAPLLVSRGEALLKIGLNLLSVRDSEAALASLDGCGEGDVELKTRARVCLANAFYRF